MEPTNLGERVFRILNAPTLEKMEFIKNKEDFSFVYYTSAETLFSIIDNKEIWMRRASVMNDHAELGYGRKLIKQHIDGEIGALLRKIIFSSFPDFMDFIQDKYNLICNSIQFNTYLTCISEHLPAENLIGRLSMWRAYAPDNGVAIVLNKLPFVSQSNNIGAATIPVRYISGESLEYYIGNFVRRIHQNMETIRLLDHHSFNRQMINAIRYAICSIEHPGFHEEREYRIIYNPDWEQEGIMKSDIKSVNGVPQLIYKIPLPKEPNSSLPGGDIGSLISKIIVGPSKFPFEIAHAIRRKLANENITDADKKVIVSDIPLRV